MPTISLTKDSLEFVRAVNPKHAHQILMKCIEVSTNPIPNDAKPLKGGGDGLYRVDSGEYRILYLAESDLVTIAAIGKRNDDELYKEARRKGNL